LENRNCEFRKKDGTQCKKYALPGKVYCQLHLKVAESLQNEIDSGSTNKQKNGWFYLFFIVIAFVFWIGMVVWSTNHLLDELTFIKAYYYLGQANSYKWLYRVFSLLRYISTAILYSAILAQIFTEGKMEKYLRRVMLSLMFAVPLIIGIQNLFLYEIIGWDNLDKGQLLEGVGILFGFLNVLIIWLASKYQSKNTTKFLSFIYDTLWTISPVLLVFALSSGESSYFGEPNFLWFDGTIIIFNLILFSIGVDDLKGAPSLLSRAVVFYFGAATGEVSLQTIQSKKAEALQTALQEFKKMPPLQQEQLSEWIVANFKPNTMQRVWGILKLVVSTFLLTILAQEPAVAFLKWFLKHFFNISY